MRFYVVMAVSMNIILFWYVTPCSLVEFHLLFGGTCCSHLQGWRISRSGQCQGGMYWGQRVRVSQWEAVEPDGLGAKTSSEEESVKG